MMLALSSDRAHTDACHVLPCLLLPSTQLRDAPRAWDGFLRFRAVP